MIFQHTWRHVLDGTKWQSARLPSPNCSFVYNLDGTLTAVLGPKGHRIWAVGQSHAVQPARGARGLARITITSLRVQDVRGYSRSDALAEGFPGLVDFWEVWCQMHDPKFPLVRHKRYGDYWGVPGVPEVRGQLRDRPSELYKAIIINWSPLHGGKDKESIGHGDDGRASGAGRG